MKRAIVALAILVAVVLATAGAASAAAPRIVIVSGSALPRPIVITDWTRIFAVVNGVVNAPALPRSQLAHRPRLPLSLFWGPRWNDYLAAGRPASALRPIQADQQGAYYPASRGRPAAIDLPWAGRWPRLVPPAVARLLARFGVPARVTEPVDPWAAFRRPLTLPRLAPSEPCPVSPVDAHVDWTAAGIGVGVGAGPVYPLLGRAPALEADPDTDAGGPWQSQKLAWYVAPSYTGPVLVRGRRLDGPEWMRFDGGNNPNEELRIGEGETVYWNGRPEGSRGWPSSVRVRASGCYGVQIDGTSFSRTVVFQVALSG